MWRGECWAKHQRLSSFSCVLPIIRCRQATIFGRVTDGLDVVGRDRDGGRASDKTDLGVKMERVTISDRGEFQ